MKFFKDPGLQEPVETVDLGVVPAGQSRTVTIYVLNDKPALLTDLKFEAGDLEVEGPAQLKKGQSAPVVITWSASLTLRQPLDVVLEVSGTEIYYSRGKGPNA